MSLFLLLPFQYHMSIEFESARADLEDLYRIAQTDPELLDDAVADEILRILQEHYPDLSPAELHAGLLARNGVARMSDVITDARSQLSDATLKSKKAFNLSPVASIMNPRIHISEGNCPLLMGFAFRAAIEHQ